MSSLYSHFIVIYDKHCAPRLWILYLHWFYFIWTYSECIEVSRQTNVLALCGTVVDNIKNPYGKSKRLELFYMICYFVKRCQFDRIYSSLQWNDDGLLMKNYLKVFIAIASILENILVPIVFVSAELHIFYLGTIEFSSLFKTAYYV